jgi:hypothetical protein
MKPALTPEEWGKCEVESDKDDAKVEGWVALEGVYALDRTGPDAWVIPPGELYIGTYKHPKGEASGFGITAAPEFRHALAALALHGQPFGFTHADVNLLLDEMGMLIGDIDEEERARWVSLAERIEALLPPVPRDGRDG